MADRIQMRRDTAERWSQYNPILLEGEVGYLLDNPNQYKVGDGEHAWNDLPLRGGNSDMQQASETELGGVKAAIKTDNETVEVKIDPVTGKLYVPAGGSTGGGTTNYEELSNKPKIGGIELSGNKSLDDLGIASSSSVLVKQDKIDDVNISVEGDVGTPSGSASFSGGTLNIRLKNIKGNKGDVGPANKLQVGNVTISEDSYEAKAEILGEYPNQTLNLTIPRGLKGDSGVQLGDIALVQDFGYDEDKVVSQRALTEKLYGNNSTETITDSDITKHDGQYYSLKDKILKTSQYYFYSEVDVPVNAKELEMRFELSTSGGIGVEFRGSDGSVTGTFSNTAEPSGTKLRVSIPTGTTSMIFSYLNEAGVEYQSSQPFDGITFYKSIYYKVHDINVQNYIGCPIRLECEGGNNTNVVRYYIMTSNNVELSTELEWSTAASWNITLPSNAYIIRVQAQNRLTTEYPTYLYTTLYVEETITSTDSSFTESNSSQQGGGVSGKGVNPGTQTDGNDFGAGANQTVTNYRYVSGGGGGGWYGGGASHSDSSVNQINASGGGSGFVNTANNASHRPSGYTGLQLDSGSTKDGSLSFPSPSGGSETGHGGHGYARITVLE